MREVAAAARPATCLLSMLTTKGTRSLCDKHCEKAIGQLFLRYNIFAHCNRPVLTLQGQVMARVGLNNSLTIAHRSSTCSTHQRCASTFMIQT